MIGLASARVLRLAVLPTAIGIATTGVGGQLVLAAVPPVPVRAAPPLDASCVCPAVPTAADPKNLSSGNVDAQRQTVSILAARICAEATQLPKGASTDDIEAAIVFTTSQSDTSKRATLEALNSLSGCDYGQRHFKSALDRVRTTLLRRGLERGTAALGGISYPTRSSFTDPTINVGGGTSNYTR